MNIIEKLNEYGLTVEQYEEILKDIESIKNGACNCETNKWQYIVDKYDLPFNKDSIRKANDTIFGGHFIKEYTEYKLLNKDVCKNKIDEVKNIIGELDIKKQEVRNKTNQLNAIKRDFVKSIEIANDLKQFWIDNGLEINVPDKCLKEPTNNDFGTMIVHITDWHIGYVIKNCRGNNYNFKIAQQRIEKLIDEIYKYYSFYGIDKIIVVNTGDTIEHDSMRKNQRTSCEFPQAIQINKASKLIYSFLVRLCEFSKVEYYGIAGNHDRMQGDKNNNEDGNNANTIINDNLHTYNEIKPISRLTIHEVNYMAKEIKLEVEGTKHKFIHGNERIKDGKRLIENDFSMDNEAYDVLWTGHWHNFSIQSENRGRYVVRTGCLSGYNDYSTTFGCATEASQTIAVIDNGKIEMIKDVILS